MPEIWFCTVEVKTKTGKVSENIVSKKMSDKDMQKDKDVARKLMRLEKNYKGWLEKDKATGFPLINSVKWLKFLSESNG